VIIQEIHRYLSPFEGGQGGCQDPEMKRNKIIYYNPTLKERARRLRIDCTSSENLLWSKIRRRSLGYEFHRQVPIDEYIVDFYCHELRLAIEVDGSSHDNKQEYDLRRQWRLESLGVRFIRFEDIDVKRNLNDVLRALLIVISELEESNDFSQVP
jgi:very-short-patch-repair endonuclease